MNGSALAAVNTPPCRSKLLDGMGQWASVVIIKAGHLKKKSKIISDNFDYHHPLSLARGETQPEF
jgi:hypothetical protein